MGTVKRDVSAVEASYELSGLPLYRSSHTFKSVSLSGSRVLEKGGSQLTRNTALDKYLERRKDGTSSFYKFICRLGKVPVINGSEVQASWSLEENFCRNMLILHWPNWGKFTDLTDAERACVQQSISFLETENYPNFVKAEIDRVKKHNDKSVNEEAENQEAAYLDEYGEPEWIDLVRPVVTFVVTFDVYVCMFRGPQGRLALQTELPSLNKVITLLAVKKRFLLMIVGLIMTGHKPLMSTQNI